MFDWDELKSNMAKGVVVVTFKKSDGSIRRMECTLADYLLPQTKGSGKPRSDNIVTVFDIEAEAWRSFKKDSVISVETFE